MTVPTMTSDTLRARTSTGLVPGAADGLQLIDVRTPGEFAAGSVPGARNLPLERIGDHTDELRAGGETVLVCRTGRRAHQAARALVAAGISPVTVLDGGLEAYATSAPTGEDTSAGLPAAMRAGWGLERQVRLVAGSLVASSILASIWRPRARFLAGAVGTGLTVAALTNTCAMGRTLSALPFNRPRARQ